MTPAIPRLTCQELSRLLGDWLAGDLPPDQLGALQRHVSRCPDCGRLAEGYRNTVRLAPLLRAAQIPPDMDAHIIQTLRAAISALQQPPAPPPTPPPDTPSPPASPAPGSSRT